MRRLRVVLIWVSLALSASLGSAANSRVLAISGQQAQCMAPGNLIGTDIGAILNEPGVVVFRAPTTGPSWPLGDDGVGAQEGA